jgi:fucose 4-O-acetylase-like acetyltransferase
MGIGNRMNPDGSLSGRPSRTLWVDYARGIGILLVVYGHVARGLHGAGLFSDDRVFSIIDSVIYTFHIPLFFLLSGFFCMESLNRKGPREFTAGKCRTIFYPYVVWSLLQGTAEAAFAGYTNGSVTMAQVLSFLWAPRAQFWFLYVLFFMFLAAAFFRHKMSPRHYLPVMIATAGLYVIRNSLPEALPVRYFAANLVFFSFGIYCNRTARIFKKNQAVLFFIFVAGFVFGQVIFHYYLQLTFRTERTWLTLPVSLISVLGTVACCRMITRFHWPWLAYLGQASLSIYLMHILAAAGVRIFFDRGLGVGAPGIHLAAGVAAGIIAPLLIRAGVKRTGWRFLYHPVGLTAV